MRLVRLTATVLVGIACLSLLAPIAQAEEPPVRRALMIGINEYQTDEFTNLRGAVNDVEAIQQILIAKLGFQPENINLLLDSAATRAGILAAFKQLADETRPQDIVYIHFSGHGSQVEDFDGDEKDDGYDETILPHDARSEGVPDITDDELGAFLGTLKAETAVIVLDACHSGTATRSALRTRSVPVDSRADLYRNLNPANKKVATRALVRLDKPERYVLLSGAASHQSALDGPVGGKYFGLFSYALSEGLNTLDVESSPRDLHAAVQQTFRQLSEQFGGMSLPEPQIEAAGPRLDAPLFGTVLRGVGVVSSAGSGAANTANADFEMPTDDGADTVVAEPAVMAQPALPTAEPIGLVVRWAEIDLAMQGQLEEAISAIEPQVRFVGGEQMSRFVVDVVSGVCRVYGANGVDVALEFPFASVEDTAQRIGKMLVRSAKASMLVAMTNPGSKLQVKAAVVGAGQGPLRIRKQGEPRTHQNSLMIEVETNMDSYLTIVDVDAVGGLNVLFPNGYTQQGFLDNGFIRAGQTTRIPDSLQTGNQAGFFWDYQPPVGMDTIQVFASSDLPSAQAMRDWLREESGAATRGKKQTGKAGSLERLASLREAMGSKVMMRGVGVVADVAGGSAAPSAAPAAAPAATPTVASTDSTTASMTHTVKVSNTMATPEAETHVVQVQNQPTAAGSGLVKPAPAWNAASIRIRVDP